MKGKVLRRTIATVMSLVIVGGVMPAAGSGLLSVRPITASAESDEPQAGSVSFKNGKLTLSGAITADMLDEYRTDATSIVAAEGTVLPENCAYLFSKFSKVKTIDLSKADSGNVTSMMRMFGDCESLTSLDVSNFDTRRVTSMYYMFYKCTSLTSLDLSDFNTLSLKNAGSMFESCEQLETLDISSFDTSSIPDNETPYHMFKNCYALRTIYASRKADFSKFRIFGMFDGCKVLTGEMGTVIKPNNGVHVYSTNKYAHIDDGEINPGYFTYKANEDSYFDKETETLVLSGYVNKDNIDRKFLFNAGMNSKIKYIDADSTAVLPADCTNLFSGLNALEFADFSHIDSSRVKSIGGMFYKCKSLKMVDLRNFDSSKITDMRSAFSHCEKLEFIMVGDDFTFFGDPSASIQSGSMFYGCTSLVGGNDTAYNSSATDGTYARLDKPGQKGYFSQHCTTLDSYGNLILKGYINRYELNSYRGSGKGVNSIVISDQSAVLPEDCSGLFKDFPDAQMIVISGTNNAGNVTKYVKNMSEMFSGCTNAGYIAMIDCDTSSVTDMSDMFYSCKAMTGLDISSLDTGNVTDMSGMFSSCKQLTELDLSSFDTRNVTNMAMMFTSCLALKTITIGELWSLESERNSTNMFRGCTNLVGGIGTKFSTSHTNSLYARVDTVSEPGYFTADHPVVISNSMTLGGSIGLNFYVAPSGLTEANLPKTYVVFDVNGKQQTAQFDATKMNGKKTGYGFTCKLNSVSMADEVKATVHYFDANGTEKTFTKTATCEQYLRKFNEQLDGGTKTWDLIKGINDYGYYMQQYLSKYAASPWTLGKDHIAMEMAFADHSYYTSNKNTYLSALKPLAKSFGKNDNIEKVNYSLNLDSDTSLTFKFKPVKGYSGKFDVTVDGTSVTPKKLSDGRYQVTIANIPAHKLDTVHTIVVTTDSGKTTYKACALSYVYECINGPLSDLEFDAMCAMYEYYKAAVAFKA